ncbi:MAG: glycosyltransferase family A protein [Acidobacteriaceae bacterium]
MEPSESPIALSLIVATVGRTEELSRLLRSLGTQQFPWLELIIVDQNSDDRVKSLLDRAELSVRHTYLRSPRGVSRARNAGLAIVLGAIIGFPDDDCWYPANLLEQIKEWFDHHAECQFLCCSMRDETGREVAARWPLRSQRLDSNSVLQAAASASLFIRREALRQVGGFDEQIGLGAVTPFQSGEDTDLAIRCLRAGGNGWFEKSLYVHHPRRDIDRVTADRALAYGIGFGYLLGKHGYPVWSVAYHIARAFGGMVKSLLLLRITHATFYWHSVRGRWKGYATLGRTAREATRLLVGQDRADG